MDGTWNVLMAFLGMVGVLALWGVVLFVIPGLLALYGARLFPLTGQWLKLWAERRKQAPKKKPAKKR